VLFAPSVSEIYAEDEVSEVRVPGLDGVLEGACRPGHFTGVATVVSKLLNSAQADHAFFGEKDYQQLQVITCMAEDLFIPTIIHGVATVREQDGLALSSRNAYLTDKERAIAPVLYATLTQVAEDFRAGGDGGRLELKARETLAAAGFDPVDYVAIVDAVSFASLHANQPGRPARVLAAARLGRARLIDNVPVGPI
jgi:pantoate--beta-alanine ligase